MPSSPKTTPADEDRKALARFYECADDGQDVDIGKAALIRLEAIGWIEKVDRRRWQVSGEGFGVLEQMEEDTHAG